MRLTIGTRVKAERQAPAKGTWKRYAGKRGTVVRFNDGEIGVEMDGMSDPEGHPRVAWFLPTELLALQPRRSA